MPDQRDLHEILSDAVSQVSPETQKELATHPQAPALVKRVQEALGLKGGSDVMSPAEQVEYKKATEDTPTTPSSSDTNLVSKEDIIRNQAISDMAEAAAKPKSSGPSSQQETMVNGVSKILLDSANKAIKASHDYASDLYNVLTAPQSK